jgi:hypothetical protein
MPKERHCRHRRAVDKVLFVVQPRLTNINKMTIEEIEALLQHAGRVGAAGIGLADVGRAIGRVRGAAALIRQGAESHQPTA